MSAPATEAAPAKKKGKLPIIIAIVVALAGGGFFMTKSKGKEKDKSSHEIVMGDVEIEIKDEFLVNMVDASTYVRCKIILKAKKDYKVEEIEKHKGEIADAINLTLKATDPKQTATLSDMKLLKKRMASAINAVLQEEPAEEEPSEKDSKKKKTKSIKIGKSHDDEEQEIPEDWDSLEGPILKVLFLSFATQ